MGGAGAQQLAEIMFGRVQFAFFQKVSAFDVVIPLLAKEVSRIRIPLLAPIVKFKPIDPTGRAVTAGHGVVGEWFKPAVC